MIPPIRPEKPILLGIASGLLLTIVLASSLPARDLAPRVGSLFELGRKNTPSAVTAAKSYYEQLKREYPSDRRIDYAYGIVLLNQRQYRESLGLLTYLQGAGQPNVSVSRAKVWALVQDRKVADALEELVALSKRVARSGDRDPDRSSVEETARFIGAMFGYLELVRSGAVDSELRTNQRCIVLENLSDRYTPLFDAGRAAVAERLATLKSDHKLFQERKTASDKERQELDEVALDGDHGEIATTEEAMQSHLESVRDAQREWNVIKTQFDSLRTDRTRLSAQIVTVQAQIDALQPPSRIVVNVSPNGSATAVNTSAIGPRGRDRLLTNPQYNQIFALSVSLGRLNKQAFDMDRRLLSLQQRSAELSERSLRDADELDRHDAAVQKTAKRAKALEKKINRESAAPKPSTPVLTSQMSALSTYLPFPYEQERKRVLVWFEK
jgi:hypothetical protein